MTLRDFANQRTSELSRKVQQELLRTAAHPDADAIHDLRVSVRRYTQALRALKGVFLKSEVKKKRRELRHTMDLTAEVRNRDIALDLLAAAGVPAASPLSRKLKRQRESASKALLRAITPPNRDRTRYRTGALGDRAVTVRERSKEKQ